MVDLARRSFIAGLGAALITAPAIVRAGSLMPVKQMIWAPDDIAALLDARLDVFHGDHDQRIFKRYGGYDPVEFDATAFRWKSPERVSEEAAATARGQLFDLHNAHLKNRDPGEFERLKARWTRIANVWGGSAVNG